MKLNKKIVLIVICIGLNNQLQSTLGRSSPTQKNCCFNCCFTCIQSLFCKKQPIPNPDLSQELHEVHNPLLLPPNLSNMQDPDSPSPKTQQQTQPSSPTLPPSQSMSQAPSSPDLPTQFLPDALSALLAKDNTNPHDVTKLDVDLRKFSSPTTDASTASTSRNSSSFVVIDPKTAINRRNDI